MQVLAVFFPVFFFSSRRRHTRWPRDWSSDVCSSDLEICCHSLITDAMARRSPSKPGSAPIQIVGSISGSTTARRSEERRVGKEGRDRRSRYKEQKKIRETEQRGVADNREERTPIKSN